MTRAVTMTTTLIRNLLEKPEMTSSAAATDAYEKVLKPYHGWITSKLVLLQLLTASLYIASFPTLILAYHPP